MFKLVIKTLWKLFNKEKNYRELKESIRMMNIQRSDTEKINLIEEGKRQVLMRLLNIMKLFTKV